MKIKTKKTYRFFANCTRCHDGFEVEVEVDRDQSGEVRFAIDNSKVAVSKRPNGTTVLIHKPCQAPLSLFSFN